MGRKFIPAEGSNKQRKIFLDDLKKIHKRKVRQVPAIPSYSNEKSDDTTSCSDQNEMQF